MDGKPWGLSQHISKTCGQALPEGKNFPGRSRFQLTLNTHGTLIFINILNVFHVTDTYCILSFPCTDPDWKGTVTEQTAFHLFFLIHLDFYKCIVHCNLCV